MHGRNTTIMGVRVTDSVYAGIKAVAAGQGLSLSDWVKSHILLPDGSVVTTAPAIALNTMPKDAITLPADLLAKIEAIKDVKSGKKTVSQWAIPYLEHHASFKHHGIAKDGQKY